MKNEKLITGRVSTDRPVIIGRVPSLGRNELMKTRLNWGEQTVIAIPVERNLDGSHNIPINLDFDLPLSSVRI